MKKIIFSLLLISSISYAADSSSGCGAGWYIFKKNSLVSSVLRTTTNVFALNTVGMTRNNIPDSSISLIKKAYKLVYRKQLKINQAIKKIKDLNENDDPYLNSFVKSIEVSERGILR